MRDYGKAQAHLAREGKGWNYPGKAGPRAAKVPAKWTGNEREWAACMAELGFEWVDDGRWCATESPTETSFGWCVIVKLNDGVFDLSLTIDTVENEQDSPWVYPSAAWGTPLEAAKAAMAFVNPMRVLR